jgi:uncharacterized membrane protein YdbT with pleckstrin-like domain
MKSKIYQEFKPIPTKGGTYSIILFILVEGILCVLQLPLMFVVGGITFLVFVAAFILGMGFLFGTIVLGYYKIDYLVGDDRLILRWGLIRKVVPI